MSEFDRAPLAYEEGGRTFEGAVIRPGGAGEGSRPCVLFAPAWAGLTAEAEPAMRRYAALGYVVAGLDLYGAGVRGDPAGDNSALMAPLMADRALLGRRLLSGYRAAAGLDGVDPTRMAVAGYCFGGLCALDLARAAPDGLRAAISFHGLLKPTGLAPGPIAASVLVCHGWADPMVPPADVVALGTELEAAGGDWQLHAYGRAMHGFTHPHANAPERGVAYDAAADARSWAAATALLADKLG